MRAISDAEGYTAEIATPGSRSLAGLAMTYGVDGMRLSRTGLGRRG
ncbi:MAG: hypothetical protein HY835_01355 [Anaerolineae bacterium]|nr:hypothetical protein [Anaerolineae bacterium]